MEALYHQTNRQILHLQTLLQNLGLLKRSGDPITTLEEEIEENLKVAKGNCDKLDILVQKEPPNRRQSWKLRINQLKYDFSHIQNAMNLHKAEYKRKLQEANEREELLSRRFTQNTSETTIEIDYSIQHHRSLQNANRGMDDLLGSGSSVLENLKGQRERLKGSHRRMMDIMNTLGLSNTSLRLIERRIREDKVIFYGGIIVTLLIMVLVLYYVF